MYKLNICLSAFSLTATATAGWWCCVGWYQRAAARLAHHWHYSAPSQAARPGQQPLPHSASILTPIL